MLQESKFINLHEFLQKQRGPAFCKSKEEDLHWECYWLHASVRLIQIFSICDTSGVTWRTKDMWLNNGEFSERPKVEPWNLKQSAKEESKAECDERAKTRQMLSQRSKRNRFKSETQWYRKVRDVSEIRKRLRRLLWIQRAGWLKVWADSGKDTSNSIWVRIEVFSSRGYLDRYYGYQVDRQ